MSQPAKTDRKANLITGAVVLAAIAGILIYAGLNELLRIPEEKKHAYVAYFENSGGLREGDRVRIQGRAAGTVTKVDVVNHDGRVVTRVEFEITPGTGSPWLTQMERAGGIPSDSTVTVRMPSMLGRPVLVISIGKDDANPIAEGGEWVNTTSANELDQLSQWGEDIDRAKTQIRTFNDFFEDDEKFAQLSKNLGDIADALEKADGVMADLEGRGAELDEGLTKAQQGMDEMRAGIEGSGDSTAKALGEVVEKTGKTAVQLDELAEDLSRAMKEVDRISGTLGDTVSDMEKSKLAKLGIELRRLSSSLRAGMAIAEKNPKEVDLPNWRRSRPYFHGGEPTTGTSIDEPPPEAPAEKVGIPKGNSIPKREK
jgi:ABC-type transporter Mla subunit MlaD